MVLSFSVGYTARDLVYQWTAGRGVNIARYQHQIVMMIPSMMTSASKSSIRWFVITEKAPTRAFSGLKAATTAFTFKTLLRHY